MSRVRTQLSALGRHHRWLLVALLLGLAVRTPLMLHADDQGVPGDQIQYSAQAMSNAEGRWFQQPFDQGAPAAEHPPLTSAVLTPITWVFSDDGMLTAQRAVVLLFGMLNIVLLYVLGRRWSSAAAIACAMLAAVDLHLVLSDVLILSETFGVTLMTLLLITLTRTKEALLTRRSGVQIGVLLGLLLLTRAELTLLVPLVCAWRWWAMPGRRSRSALAAAVVPALVALAMVAPWVLWNQARFDERVVLSTNDGFTLLGANCDDTYYGENIGGYSINCALAVEGAPGQDASVVSKIRRETATAYATDHLTRLPLVAGARFLRQWELGWILRTAHDSPAEGRPSLLVLLGSIQWWLLAALCLIAARRLGGRARWLLAIPLIVVTIAAVTVNAQWRVRSSAEPAIVLAAAQGIVVLMARRRSVGEREALVHPDR
jgi:4-amino-4-deoxy-L-arabinose transferase-like glycosyltransferase